MPWTFKPDHAAENVPSFISLLDPYQKMGDDIPILESQGDRPLQMTFDQQLKALIYFHLEEHQSGRHLIQVLKEDDFARTVIAPLDGIKKSSFFEAINDRGLEQLIYVYERLQADAAKLLPLEHQKLGDLVAIDGSLIDATLSMDWADYRKGSKKAKIHLGFDLNHSIPSKLHLTDGKAGERPFVSQILSKGQTGVIDRGYQCHKDFDIWQEEGKHFVCRIKTNTKKKVIKANEVNPDSNVFYDAIVLLGTPGVNQTEKEIRVVGYKINSKRYWVATDRYDLSAEQIATVYGLRWNIESFFGWWKRHLKVYHLISRGRYGLLVQIVSGLITYLLLAIYCHKHHGEKVSIKRVRELRIKIQNEARALNFFSTGEQNINNRKTEYEHAKT